MSRNRTAGWENKFRALDVTLYRKNERVHFIQDAITCYTAKDSYGPEGNAEILATFYRLLDLVKEDANQARERFDAHKGTP